MIQLYKRFKPHHISVSRGRRWPSSRRVLIGISVLALGYWLFFSGGRDHGRQNFEVPVAVEAAATRDVPVYLDGLGTVQANSTVTMHSQVDGRLDEVLFKEGQDVKKGDVLARIDPRTYQAQYDQAVANKARDVALLDNAKRDLRRYNELGKSVSAQVRDTQASTVRQLEATVAADQAAIDNAKTLLSYTAIVAPMDARTGIRQVDVGNIVHTSDPNGIVVLTQLEPVDIVFSLPQQNLAMVNEQLAAGRTLSVLALDADGNTTDTGTLELVDNQIDINTGAIKLKATFPNEKRTLWPGGFVNVRLMVTTLEGATVIPAPAVQRGPKSTYVFVYKPEDSTVAIRPVVIAMTQGQDAVVKEGIKPGEQVVTDGMVKLQDGAHVTLAGANQESNQPSTGAQGKKRGSRPSPG